jgi:hypothetical protein
VATMELPSGSNKEWMIQYATHSDDKGGVGRGGGRSEGSTMGPLGWAEAVASHCLTSRVLTATATRAPSPPARTSSMIACACPRVTSSTASDTLAATSSGDTTLRDALPAPTRDAMECGRMHSASCTGGGGGGGCGLPPLAGVRRTTTTLLTHPVHSITFLGEQWTMCKPSVRGRGTRRGPRP